MNSKKPLIALMVASAISLPAQIATADTLVLSPTADSYIRAIQTNQGNNELVLMGDTATADDYLRGAFAFDLSAPELSDAIISSVTLTLTINDRDASGSGNLEQSIDLHPLSASFTNNGVTWTSRDGTNNWTTPGGDFSGFLASVTANAGTVNSGDQLNFTSASLTTTVETAMGGPLYLIAKLRDEDAVRSVFRIVSQNNIKTPSYRPVLTIEYQPQTSGGAPKLSGFTYNPADGSSQVSISGTPGARYKLVEASDLDFSTPDQDPVPLTAVTDGTLVGDVVILGAGGNATVEFDLGTSKAATFIRAEETP